MIFPAHTRRCSRRCITVLVAGLALTGVGVWLAASAVAAHERDIVREQAETVTAAVRLVGDPIVQTSALAVVLATDDDGIERFTAEMEPVIARNPLVRSVTVLEALDGKLVPIARSGSAAVEFKGLDSDLIGPPWIAGSRHHDHGVIRIKDAAVLAIDDDWLRS